MTRREPLQETILRELNRGGSQTRGALFARLACDTGEFRAALLQLVQMGMVVLEFRDDNVPVLTRRDRLKG